jgi:hypothetical protein
MMRYAVEVDGVRIRLGLLDRFKQREMSTVVRRVLRERPDATIVIRPVLLVEPKDQPTLRERAWGDAYKEFERTGSMAALNRMGDARNRQEDR